MAPCSSRRCAVCGRCCAVRRYGKRRDPDDRAAPVYGGAEAFFGGCPDTVETPPAGTVCVERYVLVWRGYAVFGGGSIARSKAPWNVFAQTGRVEFTGAEEPDVTELRFGFGELDGEAAVDTVHLTVASASFRLPMSDGSIYDFAGSWRAIGDRLVFGNNGP